MGAHLRLMMKTENLNALSCTVLRFTFKQCLHERCDMYSWGLRYTHGYCFL